MERQEILEKLNERQQEAVLAVEGPVLILAGAGSGKTRVLVHRIAYMIDVMGILPGSILAITFTNKAADEMRSRVDDIIGFGSREIWVMTFHACCVRILRRHADVLGFTRYFSIYDTDDQLSLMKDIMKRRNVDTKRWSPKSVLHAISSAKNELLSPEKYARVNRADYYAGQIGDLYAEYQKRLKESNAMDFDDLIMKTVELFTEHEDILYLYQEKFRYLMVDEYQDTNTAQFKFISLLAGMRRNLCVVGDDDQSIYKFRGANIRNILNFEKIFPDAKVVYLEQNYRSTQKILDAANAVIHRNRGRKEKRLWTENGQGTPVRLRRFATGFDEADFVASDIGHMVREEGAHYKDFAVLYRTNAQSRLLEEKCLLFNIPYKLVGGVNFYARREIKDLLAYLKTIDNAVDDIAVTRIINVPKRGIGATTIAKIAAYAEDGGLPFFDAALEAPALGSLSKGARDKILSFTNLIQELRRQAESLNVPDLLKLVLEKTGYRSVFDDDDEDERQERNANIDELYNKAVQYAENADSPSLSGFLEEVALIADIDTVEDGDDRVLLMTLHAAKGLEFPYVYITGMEEGLFPSAMSINSDDPEEEIEEERRLCYVGITRAREQLTLTSAAERMIRGEVQSTILSRFVQEIPRELVDLGRQTSRRQTIDLGGAGLGEAMRSALNAKPYAPKPSGMGRYENPYLSPKQKEEVRAGGRSGGRTPAFGRAFPVGGGLADDEGGQAGGQMHAGGGLQAGSRQRTEGSSTGGQNGRSSSGNGTAFSAGTSGYGYGVGDKVRHVKFGVGVVKSIVPGPRDSMVSVDFPGWGIKKMYAGFAKLVKVEE